MLAVLRSGWLTTGPEVERFEHDFAAAAGSRHAVALSSGTAALAAGMQALELAPGDEVILPTLTFAASANAIVHAGATPVFADVDPSTLLLDGADVERRITRRTRAILAVDYAGQPCDYDQLSRLAEACSIELVSDACHSLGGSYCERPVGSVAHWTAFSLHPAKAITSGEGGVLTTDDAGLANRVRRFSRHGIVRPDGERASTQPWFYEQVDLGLNLRLSDLGCALARSQLRKLPGWRERRRAIAEFYAAELAQLPGIQPLAACADREHAWHLYVVRIHPELAGLDRDRLFRALHAEGIGAQVHYIPVHLHPYYREQFGTHAGQCPVAESAYEQILSLPLFPAMSDADAARVVAALKRLLSPHRRCIPCDA